MPSDLSINSINSTKTIVLHCTNYFGTEAKSDMAPYMTEHSNFLAVLSIVLNEGIDSICIINPLQGYRNRTQECRPERYMCVYEYALHTYCIYLLLYLCLYIIYLPSSLSSPTIVNNVHHRMIIRPDLSYTHVAHSSIMTRQ